MGNCSPIYPRYFIFQELIKKREAPWCSMAGFGRVAVNPCAVVGCCDGRSGLGTRMSVYDLLRRK